MPPPATMSPDGPVHHPSPVSAGRQQFCHPVAKRFRHRIGLDGRAHFAEHRDSMVNEGVDVGQRGRTDSVVRHDESVGRITSGPELRYDQAVSTPGHPGAPAAPGTPPAAQTRRGPEPPDISEKGGMKDGQPQRSDTRLFMQFLAFGGCPDVGPLADAVANAGIPACCTKT